MVTATVSFLAFWISIHNSAANIIYSCSSSAPVTLCLYPLHWRQLYSHIQNKLLVLTFKALRDFAPPYLSSLISHHCSILTFRSQLLPSLILQRYPICNGTPALLTSPGKRGNKNNELRGTCLLPVLCGCLRQTFLVEWHHRQSSTGNTGDLSDLLGRGRRMPRRTIKEVRLLFMPPLPTAGQMCHLRHSFPRTSTETARSQERRHGPADTSRPDTLLLGGYVHTFSLAATYAWNCLPQHV